MRARTVVFAVAVSGVAGVVAAQPRPTPLPDLPKPTLHEDVRSPRAAGSRSKPKPPATSATSVIGDEPAPGRNPTAIGTGDKILPEPPADTKPEIPEEPVLGTNDFGADRRTESPPDRKTGADGTLHYIEAFNPSVVPFKRMSALSAVREDYTLYVGDAQQKDQPVGGKPTPGWDRFWGSVLVDLRQGTEVPLPSVAPEMRILSYEVTPKTVITFSKDGADNFYARSDEGGVSGVHRLVFLVEADPVYFAPQVPPDKLLSDIPTERRVDLPTDVAAVAIAEAYGTIRVKRGMSLFHTLDKLTSYYRAFEAGDLPPSSGSIYVDLVRSQVGVCRHRAFAFMITANALGIPTRFVSNEAHAWVESWVPQASGRGGRWIRIDLGGAALNLEVENGEDKDVYSPRGEDPFSKPDKYAESTTHLSGLDSEQEEAATSRRPTPGGGGGSGAGGEGDDPNGEVDPTAPEGEGGEPNPTRPGLSPDRGIPAIPPEAARGKAQTTISVTSASPTGFRGEVIHVEGAVGTGGGAGGLPYLRVDIYLAPAGQGGEGARLVGHGVTDADGRYATDVTVPPDLELLDHEVFATTPGDDKHQPAQSR